jgi:hypothetical protein
MLFVITVVISQAFLSLFLVVCLILALSLEIAGNEPVLPMVGNLKFVCRIAAWLFDKDK